MNKNLQRKNVYFFLGEGIKQIFFLYSPIFFYFSILYLFTFYTPFSNFFSAILSLSFSNEYKTVSVALIIPIYPLYNILYLTLSEVMLRGAQRKCPEEMPGGNARRKCPEFFSFPSGHLPECPEKNRYVNSPKVTQFCEFIGELCELCEFYG